jgi:peptidyl-prolyl cis-trans isomerase D
MLELLRNFLSGKRVVVIAILLAIPFVFFGSTSFGTSFTSYGTVNGEAVSQMDVSLATSQVAERLKSVYGEDFDLDDLDETVSIELIKNEIINQKTLVSQAKDLGLTVSLQDAKKEIINLEIFQGDEGFDPAIFEATIRANGWTPDEYFALVQESIGLDRIIGAMSSIAFPLQRDLESLASMLETSRDINFIKADKAALVSAQDASLEEAEDFYNENPFLFLSEEKRDFSYILLSYDEYRNQVSIPENYVDEAYSDYLNNLDQQIQNRISHYMIEKSNYENEDVARNKILSDYEQIISGQISFEDIVESSSEDLVSKDQGGDLGLSSGDAFPIEFENAILKMSLNQISEVIELEDTFHILKLTEVLKPQVKSKSEMEKDLLNELIDAESRALMQDDFLRLESLVLEGLTLNELSNEVSAPIQITGLKGIDEIQISDFSNVNSTELFSPDILPNKIEIFESEDSYLFVMLTQAIQPSVQEFVVVAENAIQEVRTYKANKLIEDYVDIVKKSILEDTSSSLIDGFSKENFKAVKRFSSLLPPELITAIFNSSIGELVTYKATNGDQYWVQSSNEVTPTADELGDVVSRYEEFYNSSLGQQFSGFIDHTMRKGQRVRLQNLASDD